MDNPRYERYMTSTPRQQGRWELRVRRLCTDLAHKIGLRQLKPRTALIAGALFVAVAGIGLVRSGLFRASDATSGDTAAVSGATPPQSTVAPPQAAETTVTVHVVVDRDGAVTVGDAAPAQTASGSTQPAGGKINLNTADEAALETLPGIGPVTAQKIIADRKANGPFTSPEDLQRVSGIGPKKYDAVKDLITAP